MNINLSERPMQPFSLNKRCFRKMTAITVASFLLLSGCAITHEVGFHELNYSVSEKQLNKSAVAIISRNTLEKKVPVRAFATGYGHIWEIQPGLMLETVADIELRQLFSEYKRMETRSSEGELILVLTIPEYNFKNYHAYFTVNLAMSNKNGKALLNKDYKEEGSAQAGKMLFAGAFGMKSSIRQSSLNALKKIFENMRADIRESIRNDI